MCREWSYSALYVGFPHIIISHHPQLGSFTSLLAHIHQNWPLCLYLLTLDCWIRFIWSMLVISFLLVFFSSQSWDNFTARSLGRWPLDLSGNFGDFSGANIPAKKKMGYCNLLQFKAQLYMFLGGCSRTKMAFLLLLLKEYCNHLGMTLPHLRFEEKTWALAPGPTIWLGHHSHSVFHEV